MSKKLTQEFIAMRTKNDRLDNIRNLNLWGNDLDDVSVLKHMPNLEVVSLSVNKIRTLKDFSYLKNLRELYLRKNSISDINEVKYLIDLKNLRVLWLSENPVANTRDYRNIVITLLPQITKLDDTVISVEERKNAQNEEEDDGFEDKSWDEGKIDVNGDEEDNVFESQKFTHDNNIGGGRSNLMNNNLYTYERERENIRENTRENVSTTPSEIYSNNERNRKIKDKFNNNNLNVNNILNNPSYNKKFSVNYEDTSNLAQNFSNLDIREGGNIQKNIKRTNTAFEPRSNSGSSNNVVNVNTNYENRQGQRGSQSAYGNNRNIINNRDAVSNLNNIAQNRSSNVFNCVVMLLKELNDAELEMLRNEIDKKLIDQ